MCLCFLPPERETVFHINGSDVFTHARHVMKKCLETNVQSTLAAFLVSCATENYSMSDSLGCMLSALKGECQCVRSADESTVTVVSGDFTSSQLCVVTLQFLL